MRDLLGSSAIDRVIALRSFPGYGSLSLDAVDGLASAAEDRHVTTGEYLFRAGEVPAEVFFITSGRVETRKSGQVIRDFTTGSAVGGLAALGDNLHGYDCVAVEDSTLIVLKMTHMTDIFEEHFQIIRAVLSAISGQMLDLRQAVGPDGGYGETTWEPDGPPPPRMNLIERLALLRGGMQFAGSRLEALADLARQCDEVRLEAGDVLWREGEPAESFVFVVWGAIQAEGAGGVVARFGPGDVVGFLGPFSGRARWYTAKAETDVVGLRLSSEVLLDVCEDHTELALEMIRTLARGLLAVMVNSAAPAQQLAK
ncbi:MAG: CRP/FNR family cyclic AMP-dependent transcriptional regulator [Polyangiales bacterium]|jgi:CRP/FNR family cyclic AMP-dependent transcriptional regulator